MTSNQKDIGPDFPPFLCVITGSEAMRLSKQSPKGRLTKILELKFGDELPVKPEKLGQVVMVPYTGPDRTYFLTSSGDMYVRLRHDGKTDWVYPAKRSGT